MAGVAGRKPLAFRRPPPGRFNIAFTPPCDSLTYSDMFHCENIMVHVGSQRTQRGRNDKDKSKIDRSIYGRGSTEVARGTLEKLDLCRVTPRRYSFDPYWQANHHPESGRRADAGKCRSLCFKRSALTAIGDRAMESRKGQDRARKQLHAPALG